MPEIAQSLKKIEEIPTQLEEVVSKINQSQERLASNFLAAAQDIVNTVGKEKTERNVIADDVDSWQETDKELIPSSIKWTVIVGIIIISIATVGNTSYNIWRGETSSDQTEQTKELVDSIAADSIIVP